jgi:hypothetical protein
VGPKELLREQRRRSLSLGSGDVEGGEPRKGDFQSIEQASDRLQGEAGPAEIRQSLDIDESREIGRRLVESRHENPPSELSPRFSPARYCGHR